MAICLLLASASPARVHAHSPGCTNRTPAGRAAKRTSACRGRPVAEYVDKAVRHVLLRQGVLGLKVKILLDWDPSGKQGPKTPFPDKVMITAPKEDENMGPPKMD
mmetsp:Transcript_7613/g.28020  ORF Transcript_7613/g.28020 Transcript_7613/m.28020 type:complete len:105 (+) Transcript_7613:740-1054(+)